MIIAQISDTHIRSAAAQGAAEAGMALQRALAHVLDLSPRPDALLITGDCANTGGPEEYARFQEILRPFPVPWYAIPGNHDDQARMLGLFGVQGTHALPGFAQYAVDDWPVRLIALDTQVAGQDGGALCAERLRWLEDRLAEAPARPTLIFMHHPPVRTGLAAMDAIGLDGADALAAVIGRHPQVERLVAGHVHMALTRRFAGSVVMTCPATGHTLLPDFARTTGLAVLREPPACLVHAWREDTGMVSYASLIGEHGPIAVLHDGAGWIA